MPVDKSRYPDNWNEITARIRARANNRCEICGVENHRYIARFIADPEKFVYAADEEAMYWNANELQDKDVYIVLTVAHLNHDTTDNRDENLACLCQLHHLRHDAQYHAQNARKTRLNKKREAVKATGQKEMWE